ncbi:hypothetical protein CGRA01v4_13518 [Colletotrichum graminicola]|nr:hypothetical protein CGRA01v4_13518 [Colletotrichum graminicola]
MAGGANRKSIEKGWAGGACFVAPRSPPPPPSSLPPERPTQYPVREPRHTAFHV